ERSEESEPLDVIEVQVREHHVDAPQGALERAPERTDASARVEDEHRPLRAAHLDTRSVAAVARRVRSRRRDGAARAPEACSHDGVSQKITTAPRTWSVRRIKGKAVASMWRRVPSRPRIQK